MTHLFDNPGSLNRVGSIELNHLDSIKLGHISNGNKSPNRKDQADARTTDASV
jgi:hypothetical protein